MVQSEKLTLLILLASVVISAFSASHVKEPDFLKEDAEIFELTTLDSLFHNINELEKGNANLSKICDELLSCLTYFIILFYF